MSLFTHLHVFFILHNTKEDNCNEAENRSTMDFHTVVESEWCSEVVWLQTLLKISSFIPVCNSLKVSK